MVMIRATVRNGRIEPDEPLNLPDGTELLIPVPDSPSGRAGDEPMSPEEIERVLAAMDRMESLQMTDAELAAWEADRRARKEREKALFFEHAEKLQRMWE
jgi:hypothetical protein